MRPLPPYYQEEDLAAIDRATTFEELKDIALDILRRMPMPVEIVCGPISSGGFGSRGKNLAHFTEVIEGLLKEGKNIFSQMPFEDAMLRIINTPYFQGGNHLLTAFYLPVFEAGFIKKMHFIPGWEGSVGATWEHTQGTRLGFEIAYL